MFRFSRKTSTPLDDMNTNTVADLPPWEPDCLPSFRDVNLIHIVKEGAPLRLKTIEKELAEITTRQEKLTVEASTLHRLLTALEV